MKERLEELDGLLSQMPKAEKGFSVRSVKEIREGLEGAMLEKAQGDSAPRGGKADEALCRTGQHPDFVPNLDGYRDISSNRYYVHGDDDIYLSK